MKKLFVSIISFGLSTILFGQDSISKKSLSQQMSSFDNDVNHALNDGTSIERLLPLLAITLLVIMVIQIARFILGYKLRNKIIDRGISDQLASSILGNSVADKKDESIKWAFLLLGLSAGLTVTYHTMPLNIHSLAIMSFSIGLSYLVHYFYLRNKNK